MTNVGIYTWNVTGYPDSSISNLKQNHRLGPEYTPAGGDDGINQYCDWNDHFKDAPGNKYMFFFFADSANPQGGESFYEQILSKPLLGRIDYTLEDFEKMNWVIEINDSTFKK